MESASRDCMPHVLKWLALSGHRWRIWVTVYYSRCALHRNVFLQSCARRPEFRGININIRQWSTEGQELPLWFYIEKSLESPPDIQREAVLQSSRDGIKVWFLLCIGLDEELQTDLGETSWGMRSRLEGLSWPEILQRSNIIKCHTQTIGC